MTPYSEHLVRLVALRLHLLGVGASPTHLVDEGHTVDVRITDEGVSLRIDALAGSATLLKSDGSVLGWASDIADPRQFASMLHNVDAEIARSTPRLTASMADIADFLALCTDAGDEESELKALVEDVVGRDAVEPLPSDRNITEVFVEFARVIEQSNVGEMCVPVWDALTQNPAALSPYDLNASLSAREETARRVDTMLLTPATPAHQM